jgi:hypothetical protein
VDTAAPVQTDRRGYSLRDVDPGTLGLHVGATYHNRSGRPVAVARCGTWPPDFYLEKWVDGRWIRAYQPNCVQVRVAGALVVRPGERLPVGITIHTAPNFRSSVFMVEEIPGRYRIVVQLHAVGYTNQGAEMAGALPKEAGLSNEFQIAGPEIPAGKSLRPRPDVAGSRAEPATTVRSDDRAERWSPAPFPMRKLAGLPADEHAGAVG